MNIEGWPPPYNFLFGQACMQIYQKDTVQCVDGPILGESILCCSLSNDPCKGDNRFRDGFTLLRAAFKLAPGCGMWLIVKGLTFVGGQSSVC